MNPAASSPSPESWPEDIRKALARPVAVFGAGVAGRAATDLLRALGNEPVVYDERAGDPPRAFGPAEVDRHRAVVVSPGFAATHPWVALARRAGLLLLGELDLAAPGLRGPVVAVTGTNGKTTLVEFLAFALKRVGEDAVAAGNNGHPLSRLPLAGDAAGVVAVVEVSSFQAETLSRLPADAVLWTNLDEDHLDRHGSMEAYYDAKARLFEAARPGAPIVVGPSVADSARAFGRTLPAGTIVARIEDVADWVFPTESAFSCHPQRENLALARAWWRATGRDDGALRAAAEVFTRRRHRLSRVADVDGVSFWNDSKGTNFLATRAALRDFSSVPVHWIGGGRGKGGDVARFVRDLVPPVVSAYLLGETAGVLAEACASVGLAHRRCATLDEAVATAFAAARPGEVVLLSPGFASFDQFRDYADRGAVFERAVRGLRPSASSST